MRRPRRSLQIGRMAERRAGSWQETRVLSVGHSTRPIEAFLDLLRAHGVRVLADIRTVPRSRHNPQFERTALEKTLPGAGIRYAHLPKLGGLRRPRPDSQNAAWRNASFRGFADHMQTEEFEEGLSELRSLAGSGTVALLCAEAVPWRCHRSLVADALLARGARVEHIVGRERLEPHRMTPFARVEGERVTYPAPPAPGPAPLARRASRRHTAAKSPEEP